MNNMTNNNQSSGETPERIVPLRLQKFLSRAGVASRRGSETLMSAGRVRVNGQVVTELGSKVDPRVDHVFVDDREVFIQDQPVYIMLYKPEGYITTMYDPHGRPCVKELVPTDRYPALFPVGRLDMDTTGLLFFTTDGELAQKCLHPSRHVDKHYVALTKGKVTPKNLEALRKGVMLEDGMTQPCKADLIPWSSKKAQPVLNVEAFEKKQSIVELTIHEGRKRQVKRMLDFVGNPVVRLHRDSFGPLKLSGIEEGQWRHLTDSEVELLKADAYK